MGSAFLHRDQRGNLPVPGRPAVMRCIRHEGSKRLLGSYPWSFATTVFMQSRLVFLEKQL